MPVGDSVLSLAIGMREATAYKHKASALSFFLGGPDHMELMDILPVQCIRHGHKKNHPVKDGFFIISIRSAYGLVAWSVYT